VEAACPWPQPSVQSVRRCEGYSAVLPRPGLRRRPSFDFEGAWLFAPHSSIALHLIKGTPPPRSSTIDPKADHVSFETEDLDAVEAMLKRKGIEYMRQSIIEEDGIRVSQIFFHDPENNMIEVCNCHDLPVVLLDQCPTCPAWQTGANEKHGALLADNLGKSNAMSRNSSESSDSDIFMRDLRRASDDLAIMGLDNAMSVRSEMSLVAEQC